MKFKLRNHKPKILDAIVKIWDFKKRPDLDFAFRDVSRNESSDINRDIVKMLISKLIDSNVTTMKKKKTKSKISFSNKKFNSNSYQR